MGSRSETFLARDRLKQYCEGNGLDLGYGGDPIVPWAITVDLPKHYFTPSWLGNPAPQNLKGDARKLYWFVDCSMDYVYSSHLFEDFEPEEMKSVLREWLRVLKPGGYLVLYLPDQHRYNEDCEKRGIRPNPNHKVDNFSLEFFKTFLVGLDNIKIVHENPICEVYSFEIVIQKLYKSSRGE